MQVIEFKNPEIMVWVINLFLICINPLFHQSGKLSRYRHPHVRYYRLLCV